MEYLTTYTIDGEKYGDSVIANSWEEAETLCKIRNKGETIDGILVERREIIL